jgi:ribonuclease D
VALCAFPDKSKLARVGLATVVMSVLGMYIDKTEQCSDWQRRPLSASQVRYLPDMTKCVKTL